MAYRLYKYMMHENGWPVFVERFDECSTEGEMEETFKEAFRHHMGRKPSKSQVKKAIKGNIVISKSGNLEMHFAIIKGEN